MNLPKGLLGVSLLFWGWQTGLWLFALPMAGVIEGAALVRSRWDLTLVDFNRISDLCTLIFAGMLVWLLATAETVEIIFIILQWLPISYFAIVAAQYYSTSDRVDLRALSLVFRKGDRNKPGDASPAIDLGYPYIILCVLSASAANTGGFLFYLSLLGITAWALLPFRSPRFPLPLWGLLLLLAWGGGYLGHVGLHQFQMLIENKGMEWFSEYSSETDPFRTVTAIGEIGLLKPSDKILFRVESDAPFFLPLLLREASYNIYRFGNWFAVRSVFNPLSPGNGGTAWNLTGEKIPKPRPQADRLTITTPLEDGNGLLKIPNGAYRIENLGVDRLMVGNYGSVRVENGPKLIRYDVTAEKGLGPDMDPIAEDMVIPGDEAPAVLETIRDLDLSLPPAGRIDAVVSFLKKNYTYSLDLKNASAQSPISGFLMETRSGHCEYFAAAAVFLLRGAGIPARYAVGYSVHEYSDWEERFIVRQRHAHAWALAYVDGAWRNVDATPPDWRALEAQGASPLQSLRDFGAWISFHLSKWRWIDKDRIRKHLGWLLIPLVIILIRRLYSGERVRRVRQQQESARIAEREARGLDSEFYLIVEQLEEMAYSPKPGEPTRKWIDRITEDGYLKNGRNGIRSLLALHYRHRFDPEGIGPEERRVLREGVRKWLERN